MMNRFLIAIFSLMALAMPTIAIASTFAEVVVKCPFDGKEFKTVESMSGTRFGTYLDLKPYGPIAAPWPLAKCPSNGFVIFKNEFSKVEIAQLRDYVEGPIYQTLQRSETNYYLAAQLKGYLQHPQTEVAYTLLMATWEAKVGQQYQRYASEALEAYKRALEKPYKDQDLWVSDQFIAAELERRLGQYEAAKTRLDSLSGRPEVKSGPFHDVLELQLQLVKAKDSEAHLLKGKSK